MIHRVTGRLPRSAADPAFPSGPLSLEASYQYCEALARSRRRNFPVGSLFAPSALRKHIFALYAFAHAADDFADEPQYEGRRSAELDRWEDRLESCFHGEPADHPIFAALQDTVQRFDLPITPFASLLSGFRMDIEHTRYGTANELINYALHAAAPLGHLMLYMSGYRDPVLHRYADDLSVGLAFASMWQDLRADLDRDRIYVPAEDLRYFDLTERDLMARRATPAIDAMVRYEAARTRALFERSRPLVDAVGPDLGIELALIWHGGMRILSKISRRAGRVLEKRPRLTDADKALVVTRALAWRGGSIGPRLARKL